MQNSKLKTQNHNSKFRTEKLKIKVWVWSGMWVGIWLGYVWAKTVAGLAIHPYRSIKRMMFGEKRLLPAVLSPVVFLAGLMVVGRVGSELFELRGWVREVVAGGLGVSLIGLGLWQGLMVGLVWRFWRVR